MSSFCFFTRMFALTLFELEIYEIFDLVVSVSRENVAFYSFVILQQEVNLKDALLLSRLDIRETLYSPKNFFQFLTNMHENILQINKTYVTIRNSLKIANQNFNIKSF